MKKIRSYLEFGLINGKKKIIYDKKFDQEAYDFFMVSRYLKDMLSYKTGNIENVHHKGDLIDNLKKYAALCICKSVFHQPVFYEVGSSLMGVIEALEYINKKYKKINVKKIKFVGADNSRMMNFGAYHLHKGYKLKIFKEKAKVKCDLFFAKGVSLLYAFDEEKFFCDVLKKSRISIFDNTFSLKKDSVKTFVGTGKDVTYLSLEKCKNLLEDKKRIFILNPSERKYNLDKNLKTFECIYGEKTIVKRYLERLRELLPK